MNIDTQFVRAEGSEVHERGRLRWPALLLSGGIASALLWVGSDIAGSLLYEGYSYKDQTISELSAYDAPTRTFWMVQGSLGGALLIGFAAAIWQSAASKRLLRVTAALFAAHALLALLIGPFSSMHQREVLAADGGNFSDTLHLVMVAVGGIVFLAEATLTALSFGWQFRLYTAVTILVSLVFGFVTSMYAVDVAANEATPWVGVYERFSAYGYQLWIVVLALTLLRNNEQQT